VRTKLYFGPCRRRRGHDEYRGPERRTDVGEATESTVDDEDDAFAAAAVG
jgi:hypothetical protein